MNDRAFLSVFTPSRTPPEDLEAITVQRQALLTDACERVHESATTGHKHHLLFVGPRGTGKTHLVTLLVHRLAQDPALDDRLRVAWLNEDETSTSLFELLRRIYDALVKRYPDEFTSTALEPLFDLAPQAAEGALGQLLLAALQDRTLLVLVENLDTLFEGLGQAGQQKLRGFIQEHPVLSIVATAQRLVDDIAKRQNAFFGFFQTEHLKTLSVEQARELLRNIARLNKQSDVVTFLDSATGRSRIRALHHLSGGNHRIYIVLSRFITRDSIQALVDPFAKMVDEMTPYYQERIRWLPPQQRKIIEFLCTQDRPAPVKQIARRLFASQQTISSQLQDLRNKGYVQAAQRGRESLYEIAEPMMRICVEVKENQTHAPLPVLVDFLRVWYDGRELNARFSDAKTLGTARTYLASAIEANHAQGNLRARLLVDGFNAEMDEMGRAQWGPRIESYARQSEELALACGHWAKGDEAEALGIIDEIAGEDNGQSIEVRVLARHLAAEIHADRGESDQAIADYSAVIDLPQAPVEQVARALFNRGVVYWQLNEVERSERDLEAVLQLDGAPLASRVDSHLALAEFRVATGRWDDAMAALGCGLREGVGAMPAYKGDSANIIGAFFDSTLQPAMRRERTRDLLEVYRNADALAQLGEALTQHLGRLHAAAEKLPSPDNLETWASAWQDEGKGIDGFRLSLRIFRTGVDFLKSGGTDRGILLDLNQEERKFLEQVFALESKS